MVHHVADHDERSIEGILFDFHGTLAQVEPPVDWVLAAADACGTTLEPARATVLADRLITAGRAGGPIPRRIPPQLAEVWAERDIYAHCHRAAYVGLADTVDSGIDGLAEALYERLLTPDGWSPYSDAAETLSALHDKGVPVAVVSNIGFDIRPHFEAWGLSAYVTEFVLSYEIGRIKPDPQIFERACKMIGVQPERALMVGDSAADAGAVKAGLATLVLPAAEPGRANGLWATLALAGLLSRG
ncbi:HAD family hydrolase [Catenuloplanes japonicus]|uniref:HAD family hydrolase n=1 Tax=Catenuloplanes japonicus TaxID=33876 RepID=UPI0007C5AD64|nr:HAD-IA family hydrolase [Catenuloplanes japonicus]